ncbi:MAG: bifunctional diaminohydroxyphosphoribosylaminopyrimidine deaminase/5-amino-6-(5-phosphoribosylamino)uracil reductase RibD [Zoogloeaceae bacterium]|nr:bifunctional diaminohydroxyphosphoribosylaminopyrimidine deaminase/5-amino-6-(5-phosphoribosylamino)uracil reductase RibD [Zoogloeaceae bacterium]
MAEALALAEEGLWTTTPNPRVGCVLVKNGQILGRGGHKRAGEPHAEILALREAGEAAQGAVAYVTLEPCAHYGRTPPCADALVRAGVCRVVAAMEDPNPQVAGRGLQRLRAAGIAVEQGLMEADARELNLGFISRMTRQRPWTRLKIAATLDGKTALNNGVSQWLTGDAARADGRRFRARSCALLTGMGTVRADDPQLNVRLPDATRQPWKVILDSRLEISPDARLLREGKILLVSSRNAPEQLDALRQKMAARGARGEVEWLCLPAEEKQIDLRALMTELGRREINELHVEAGATLSGALLSLGLADELLLYFAPLAAGNAARGMFALPELTALEQAFRFRFGEARKIGDDLRVQMRLASAAPQPHALCPQSKEEKGERL